MFSGIIMPLLLGLAMFLFGMKVMELSLHQWAGDYLSRVMSRLTRTPLRGMVTGTVSSALMQSSSTITVITIGMVNAGVLRFPQTLGIILGTNIGTCITTELIGWNLDRYGLPLLCASSAIWLLIAYLPESRIHRKIIGWVHGLRCLSMALGGFSCIMLGMKVMQWIVPELQSRGLFAIFLELSQKSLLWGVLAGAGLTAIIQSSAASVAIAMGLAAVEAISIELGIAIIIGCNIGTCLTGFIASIGGSRAGRSVAWAHILLNVVGAILFIPLISYLHLLTTLFSSQPASQIAHAQTLYNVLSSLIALPLCYLPVLKTVAPK